MCGSVFCLGAHGAYGTQKRRTVRGLPTGPQPFRDRSATGQGQLLRNGRLRGSLPRRRRGSAGDGQQRSCRPYRSNPFRAASLFERIIEPGRGNRSSVRENSWRRPRIEAPVSHVFTGPEEGSVNAEGSPSSSFLILVLTLSSQRLNATVGWRHEIILPQTLSHRQTLRQRAMTCFRKLYPSALQALFRC